MKFIKTLPSEIGSLTNLDVIDLSLNQLTTLPSEIGSLTNLRKLYLGKNQLTKLPSEIGQMNALETLNLENNRLTSLPPGLQQLSNLNKLDLRGNPFLNIPPEVLGSDWATLGSPQDILNYYFQRQSGTEKPLNEAKVLIVGQGSVGKTSLVKRLIEGSFNPHQPKTEGINIQNWPIVVNDQTIRLNVWDFGGQEIMHATHQFFLTKRSLYLLVLDARISEEENRIEYWLKIIQSYGDNSPIIVVGNKIDQHPLDLDERGLQQKYPNIKFIAAVSCQNGEGIERLVYAIHQEVSQLDNLHDLLPQAWFEVKTRLEEMPEDYIPYSRFESICQDLDIPDASKQNTLIELLHRLGIVLSFREDPRLADMGVLNPEWVTNGVYKILNDRQLILDDKGILDCTQLQRILDPKPYPSHKQRFIVDIMQRFELCFTLEDGQGDRVLIPDLLPKEEPATGDWENALAFQFDYPVLPSSIISRFIVRMHHLADRRTWWRSGIVLKQRNNRTLVKADREDKRLYIWVNGPVSTRRELLSAIRSQLDAIHQSIKGLDPKAKVPIPGHPQSLVDYEHLLTLEDLNERDFIPEGLKERISVRDLLNGIDFPDSERHLTDEKYFQSINLKSVYSSATKPLEKEIFISYAWGGESEEFVNRLDDVFRSKGINIVRDKEDLGYKGLIREFMERIGRGKSIITIISDKYLKSENCMFELIQISKQNNFYQRIFPIILSDAKIYKAIDRVDYVIYWEDEIQKLEEKIKKLKSASNVPSLRRSIGEYVEIRRTIDVLNETLQNMNALTPDIHNESDFEELVAAIELQLSQ